MELIWVRWGRAVIALSWPSVHVMCGRSSNLSCYVFTHRFELLFSNLISYSQFIFFISSSQLTLIPSQGYLWKTCFFLHFYYCDWCRCFNGSDHLSLRPWSHRSIRYTVFAIAIRFALRYRRHSSDVTRKRRNLVCGGEQIIAYSEYRIAYTPVWSRPYCYM